MRQRKGCSDDGNFQKQYQTESSNHPKFHAGKNLSSKCLRSVGQCEHIYTEKSVPRLTLSNILSTFVRNMTHVRPSALDDHKDDRFIVFGCGRMNTITCLVSVWWKVVIGFLRRLGNLGFRLTRRATPGTTGSRFSHVSHKIPQR